MKKGNPLYRAYTTSEVARAVGVHRDTILRWLRKGLIHEPTRDWRRWRLFAPEDMEDILSFANTQDVSSIESKNLHHIPQSFDIERLRAINWNFADAKTVYLTHGLHPYPAKFIPQIPNALIQELSSVGETVADLFCGSGTTLVEALTLKRHAVGIDANPLACLISEAKTTRFQDGDIEALQDIVRRATSLADSIRIHFSGSLFGDKNFISLAPRPSGNSLDFWFQSFVIEELAEILQWCRELQSNTARKIALTAFSSIIVSVSKQDSDTRYVRRDKNLSVGDTLIRFAGALAESIRTVSEFTDIVEPRFHCAVYSANILEKPDIGTVDLVVCSPPYPNAYSYHLYHMTRMLWLGMDQPKFKKQEIGSHRKYSNKGPNGAKVETFRKEIETILDWLRSVLKKGRHACFVIGNSTIRGEKVDNAELISLAAKKHGFSEVGRISRRMQDTRKAFNPKIGKIKHERILILKNEN